MDCKILTINASGRIPNGEKVDGMELPKKRRAVVDKVIRDECPDIIFIQESTIQLEKFCTGYFKDLNYQSTSDHKGVGIIFDTRKFDFVKDPTTRLHKIYESKVIREESANIFALMCARILKGTEEDAQPILFVCWHGPHIKSIDYKNKLYHDLCLLLSLYASEKQIYVVVGGDFNFDLTKDKNLEANSIFPDKLAVIDYMKLERRPNKIDYILTSPKIKVVDCKPVDVSSITKYFYPELNELFAWFVTAILDHDPIVVNVIIPNQEEVFPCLSELNLNESYQNGIEDLNQFSKTQTRANHEDSEDLDRLLMTKTYQELTEPIVKETFDHDPPVANVIIPNQEEVFPFLSEFNPNESYQNGIEDLNQFSKTQTRANHEDSEDLDQLLMTKPVQDFDYRYHLLYPRFSPKLYHNNYPPFPVLMTPCKQYYYPPYPCSMPPKKTLFSLLSPYPSSMSMPQPNQYLDYYHPYQLLLTQPNQYDYYHLQSSKNVCFADIFYIDFWNPLVLYM